MTEELKKILKKPRRQCVEMYDYFGNLVELNDTILIVQNGTLTPGIVISSTEKGITISAEKRTSQYTNWKGKSYNSTYVTCSLDWTARTSFATIKARIDLQNATHRIPLYLGGNNQTNSIINLTKLNLFHYETTED